MYPRSRDRRNASISPIFISLLFQLYQQLNRSEYKPPVTIALLALNIYAHVYPQPLLLGADLSDISTNCLHPENIIWMWTRYRTVSWNRLFCSAFIHANDMHLYYNMLSLCWKGINLERKLGSSSFLGLVVFSLVVSHVLLVAISCVLHFGVGFNTFTSGYNVCAVGFSAVLFALKYVLNAKSDAFTDVFGFLVPLKYAAWCELVVVSLLTPQASFLGHLSGILAGVIYVHGPINVLLSVPKWVGSIIVNLVSTPTATAAAEDIPLESESDLLNRYGSQHAYETADPSTVQFPDEELLRQQRMRRFAARRK